MTININLNLLYQIYDFLKLYPVALIILWYIFALFFVKYNCTFTKEQLKAKEGREADLYLMVFSAWILSPIYMICKFLVRVKK